MQFTTSAKVPQFLAAFSQNEWSKDKGHPVTGHEGPEVE